MSNFENGRGPSDFEQPATYEQAIDLCIAVHWLFAKSSSSHKEIEVNSLPKHVEDLLIVDDTDRDGLRYGLAVDLLHQDSRPGNLFAKLSFYAGHEKALPKNEKGSRYILKIAGVEYRIVYDEHHEDVIERELMTPWLDDQLLGKFMRIFGTEKGRVKHSRALRSLQQRERDMGLYIISSAEADDVIEFVGSQKG